MANETMIRFLRGSVANLPATATAGAVYFTKDEGLYLGLEDGTYHRYGDYIVVNDVASLPAEGAHETCMYYCVAENVLAKWNEAEGKWIQINKQKTLAELGGVAKSVYEAKVAALEKADTDNATATANLSTYVGTIPETATATNIVAYIQEKTAGIATDTALEELTGRVAGAETDIDNLQAAIAEGGSVATAIAEAKAAGDNAQSAVDTLAGKVGTVAEGKTVIGLIETAQTQADKGVADAATAQAKADSAYTLAEGKATMEQVNAAIAGAGHAVKADVDQAIADMDAAYKKADGDMKTELEGKINAKVAQVDYDAKVAELTGADTTLQGNIDALADKVGTPTEGKTVVEMIADAQAAATYNDTQVKADIKANADAIDAIEADYLKKADKDELEEKITTNANAIERLTNGVSADEIDGVNDLINYVKEHGPEVTGMQEDIAANAKAISDHETLAAETYETKTDATTKKAEIDGRLDAVEGKVDVDKVSTAISTAVAGEKTRAEAKEAELAQADATNLQAAKDYADDAVEALGIADYIKKADADVAYATAGHNHDDKYDAKGDAAQALVDAKAYADGLAGNYDAAGSAAAAETAAKAYADGLAVNYDAAGSAAAAQSAAEATAAGALASAKTELEGKITSGNSATLASAQAYADQAEADAIATAGTNADAKVKALADGQVTTNKTDIATLFAQFQWGSF